MLARSSSLHLLHAPWLYNHDCIFIYKIGVIVELHDYVNMYLHNSILILMYDYVIILLYTHITIFVDE